MKMKRNQPLAKANPPAFTSVMKSCCTLSSSTTEIDKPGGGKRRGEEAEAGETVRVLVKSLVRVILKTKIH